MTDAVAPRDAASTDEWEHRPMFSTSDKRSRITWLAPGRSPGRVTPRMGTTALLCFVGWAAATLAGSSVLCGATSAECTPGIGQGWLIGGALVLGYLAVLATVDLSERAQENLGQRRAASMFYRAPLLAGVTVGAAVGADLALAADQRVRQVLDGVPGTEAVLVSAVVAVLAALWGVVVMVRLPGALRLARRRQETIARLRREGQRYAGRLVLGDVRFWLHGDPELDVTVTYDSPAGQHEVAARMRTSPHRVPRNGSSMIVLTDLRGAVHLELDSDAGVTFEPEERYTPSE
ncbi:hypothetical protein [Promicromonospora kroppenstedtii]|uniref:hypothetical protein n=1 Tax=Promicromonospora kroppenstedtii TaxID=440482 RepID=UPI0004B00EB4|nr:hypothetical protein [Promicromonospora kroppenstedtii]